MTIEEQFAIARDITPAFGVMTITEPDGRKVNIPMLDRYAPGALFIADDQGEHVDANGCRWLVGTRSGEIVKRRLP